MTAPRPLILFAHGAGASSSSAWMTAWADRLRAFGDVVTFDYPYMRAGRKPPDRQPALIAAHHEALAAARAGRPEGTKIVLAGKSMGSRIACHVAAEHPDEVDALVCLGYPLRGGSGATRDAVLRALRTPVLFVQGTRDPLCPLDALEALRPQLTAPNDLVLVDGGDHSLEIGARAAAATGRSQQDSDALVATAIGRFLQSHGMSTSSEAT